MAIELYRCDRLSANITRQQCELNRTRGGNRFRGEGLIIFACEGCPGLGEAVEIDLDEVIMGRKQFYGTCPTCGRENVQLTSSIGDCHRCYKRKRDGIDPLIDIPHNPVARKRLKQLREESSHRDTKEESYVSDKHAVETPETFGEVVNTDGDQVSFGVDPLILTAIDEALADLRASLLVDLSGLSAGRAIAATYRKIEAIQTLGAA